MEHATLPSGLKIVTIDDDRLIADLLSHKLAAYPGVTLFHSFDGTSGLELVRKELPGVVVLDLALPGMSGTEVLAALKKDPMTAPIPVIILSNFERDGDQNKVRELGAAHYLIKATSSLDEIVDAIASVVANAPKT